MGNSKRVDTVKQFEQRSAYSTDGSCCVVREPDENLLLSISSFSVLQIESALGGWEKGEPIRVTPTDPMNWSLYVTDKRIILWAPETITFMGGVKMKPGRATASVIYYDDLESVTLESESVNTYSFTVHVADGMLPFLTAFQGSRDVVEQIARAICNAWMDAVYMNDYDAAAREQTKMFLAYSWDKVRDPRTAGVGLEKDRGSLVYAESQESDLQQAAAALQSNQATPQKIEQSMTENPYVPNQNAAYPVTPAYPAYPQAGAPATPNPYVAAPQPNPYGATPQATPYAHPAYAQPYDVEQIQQAVQQSNRGSGLTGSKIYGFLLAVLGVVATIMGLSKGGGAETLGLLLVSLYGVYLILGGRWIIW